MAHNGPFVADTQFGAVQGYHNGKCIFFGGIPYAAPTTGDRRFKPPQAPDCWEDVKPAVYAGPVVNQNPTRFEPFLGPDPQPQSEDSLSVCVWTPALDGKKRPVYVWIHGGAYISGSGSFPLYDGSSFAERGDIVCVGINYRLGERGYLHLAHLDQDYAGSGNNALLDQIAALEWVQKNIENFGGDPTQVTVGGQSAGGGSITGLMMLPQARGLFQRAIIQSIALMSYRDMDLGEQITRTFMEAAGISRISELETTPITELLAAQRTTMRSRPPYLKASFQPVIDGSVLTQDILPAAHAGAMMDIPILLGITTDEWKPFQFFMNPEDVPRDDPALESFFDELLGGGADLVAAYRDMLGGVDAEELFAAIMSDWRWRRPTLALGDALHNKQPVYSYEFGWKSPTINGGLGAGHCVDLPFCFNNLHTPSTPYLIGEEAPAGLAKKMHGAWCAFIRNGVPTFDGLGPWPIYDTTKRATMMFDTKSHLVNHPYGDRRSYWEAATFNAI